MRKPKYKILNLHMQPNEIIYCQLVEAKTNAVEIQATLDYVLVAIRDRGLSVENVVVENETVRVGAQSREKHGSSK